MIQCPRCKLTLLTAAPCPVCAPQLRERLVWALAATAAGAAMAVLAIAIGPGDGIIGAAGLVGGLVACVGLIVVCRTLDERGALLLLALLISAAGCPSEPAPEPAVPLIVPTPASFRPGTIEDGAALAQLLVLADSLRFTLGPGLDQGTAAADLLRVPERLSPALIDLISSAWKHQAFRLAAASVSGPCRWELIDVSARRGPVTQYQAAAVGSLGSPRRRAFTGESAPVRVVSHLTCR